MSTQSVDRDWVDGREQHTDEGTTLSAPSTTPSTTGVGRPISAPRPPRPSRVVAASAALVCFAVLAGRSQEWLSELPGSITTDTVNEAVGHVASAITSIVQVLLVTLALLLDGETLVQRARSLIPERHRLQADRAGRLAKDNAGSRPGWHSREHKTQRAC